MEKILIDKKKIYRILPDVSRTFALSIKILAEPLRLWVAHAYLVCRLLDTFEDDKQMPLAEKKEVLGKIQQALKEGKDPKIARYAKKVVAPLAEKELVKISGSLILFMNNFPQSTIQSIVTWACEMADGMKKFAFSPTGKRSHLKSMEELDKYCYYVAGTVGNMLTEMFSHVAGKLSDDAKRILHLHKESFGKALQLVNIIKDSPVDYQEGRVFLPDQLFKKFHITKREFFSGKKEDSANQVYQEVIAQAESYIAEAVQYTKILPKRFYSYRLFCVLPLVLAVKTLNLIKSDTKALLANPGQVKISRKEVRRAVVLSRVAAFSNIVFDRMLQNH